MVTLWCRYFCGRRCRPAIRNVRPWTLGNLDGAILPDVDFSDCRLGAVSLTDTHFHGDSVFAGTRFADQALFPALGLRRR